MPVTEDFPRAARLLRPSEFRRVFACRKVRQNRLFRIHLAPPPGPVKAGSARIGLAIARRAVRHAHDRNRIKRTVRESFRRRRGRVLPGDYVVTANPAAATASPTELRAALDHLWQSLELK
ncbi:MAG: ribonuclease P protein component [Gammaproteobacteria bacterium HGW-Gammaproteobacteria-8]|nr:MAG: ribonuclease P protein component [Gammaproteobacteria bacterium HGW-Gammaproteobacteria-8]